MLEKWENFYLIVGSASGAFIGLLFVVATLNSGRDPSTASRGVAVYLTPTVFHLTVILAISAIATVPALPPSLISVLLALFALFGLVYAARVALQIYRSEVPETPHWTDFWFYGVAPFIFYIVLAAAAGSIWIVAFGMPYILASALLAMLVIAIRNAWDLVTWLAARRLES